MQSCHADLANWSVVATLRAGPIVLLMTVFRLVLRRRRLWLDDAYAFPSALCLIVNIAGVVIHTHNPGMSSLVPAFPLRPVI